MRLPGLSAFHNDSAAALLEGGRVVAAAQAEGSTRKKHDAVFPAHAIEHYLDAGKVDIESSDRVAFFKKPLIKFERFLESYLANAPRGFQWFQVPISATNRFRKFPCYLRTRKTCFGQRARAWLSTAETGMIYSHGGENAPFVIIGKRDAQDKH